MNLYDSIKNRRSVRTFDGKKLSEEHVNELMDYAKSVNNPYNIEIEWFILDPKENGLTSAVIVDAPLFIAGKMKRVEHAEEAFGYSFEKIILFATSLGIGTTWIAGTMNRDAFEKAVGLKEDEVMPCVSPLGYAGKKMSLREKMMRQAIKADKRLELSSLFFDGGFDKPLSLDDKDYLKKACASVQLAPSAVNKQPWRVVILDNKAFFFEKQKNGFQSKSGWDIQKIDLGIALCHFELGLAEEGKEAILTFDAPDIEIEEEMKYIATFLIK